MGSRPPQAPPILRPARRPAQPPCGRCAGVARRGARTRARARRLDAPRQARRIPVVMRRICSPTATCASSAAPSPLGHGWPGPPVRAGRGTHGLCCGRAHGTPVGRSGACLPPASRDLQHQLALPLLRPATVLHRRSVPQPRLARARWPSARPGTTTTTPSQPLPTTDCAAGSSIPVPGSSPRWSAATSPGTSSESPPNASEARLETTP